MTGKQRENSTTVLKETTNNKTKLIIMKTNLENAFAAISSMADDILTDNTAANQSEQPGLSSPKVIGMNNTDLNRDTANEFYLSENTKTLVEEGFRDASRSDCNKDTFGAKLELIKTRYLI